MYLTALWATDDPQCFGHGEERSGAVLAGVCELRPTGTIISPYHTVHRVAQSIGWSTLRVGVCADAMCV